MKQGREITIIMQQGYYVSYTFKLLICKGLSSSGQPLLPVLPAAQDLSLPLQVHMMLQGLFV